MRIVFLGPPGSGKGTQARLIAHQCNIANISTGMMLQQEQSKYSASHIINQEIINTINSGHLVNDAFITKLIFTRIQQDDCRHGFILDGFPRTIAQAIFMDENKISIDFVIQFILLDSIIIHRIMGRRIHLPSGRTYHTIFCPPKCHDIDDVSGEILTKREDDCEEAIRIRLNTYYQYIAPLINHYKEKEKVGNIRYLSINGNRDVCEIHKELINILNV